MDALPRGYASTLIALRSATKLHWTLLTNVSSLVGGTVVSAVLGFAYWWVAAHFFSLETVGLAAAAICIMQLIALFAEFGLGTILLGESLAHGDKGLGLISAALIVSFVAATSLGILFMAAAKLVSIDLGGILNSKAGECCFALGCGVTCLANVLGGAFAGLLRSSLRMLETITFSLLKLALLIFVAARYGSSIKEEFLFATWVGGQFGSVCAFALVLKSLNRGSFPAPRFETVRPLITRSLSHHLLDLVIQVPTIIMPFLVTLVLSPYINAAFNIAWTLVRVTFLVPLSFSSAMFAMGDADPSSFASRIRFSLLVSVAGAIGVSLVFACYPDTILSLFNKEYAAIASGSLQVLGLSNFSVAVKSLYLVVMRLKRQMLHASRIFAFGGCVELLFAFIGGHFGGLYGLTAGWAIATALQAAFMLPAVLSACSFRWKAALEFPDVLRGQKRRAVSIIVQPSEAQK